MSKMTNKEFAAKAKDIALKYKTLYVMGGFGAPLNAKNKKRYMNNNDYNRRASRQAKIEKASSDTFAFDCVGLIKGILWGWCGNTSMTYGGARYESNGVPDIGADSMIKKCSGISTDFSKELEIGEAVWQTGHIGIYIGDGLVAEASPAWKDKVQITACNKTISGYNRRNWKKHGKLPYVEYVKEVVVEPLKVGDKVRLKEGAMNYTKTTKFASWVYKTDLYVRQIKGDRVVVSRFKHVGTTGAVNAKDLIRV